jgi:hypothetical protein
MQSIPHQTSPVWCRHDLHSTRALLPPFIAVELLLVHCNNPHRDPTNTGHSPRSWKCLAWQLPAVLAAQWQQPADAARLRFGAPVLHQLQRPGERQQIRGTSSYLWGTKEHNALFALCCAARRAGLSCCCYPCCTAVPEVPRRDYGPVTYVTTKLHEVKRLHCGGPAFVLLQPWSTRRADRNQPVTPLASQTVCNHKQAVCGVNYLCESITARISSSCALPHSSCMHKLYPADA